MAQTAAAGGPTVLLAVADDGVRQIANAGLRREGHAVWPVADAASLLRYVEEGSPDVLVMDTDVLRDLAPHDATALHAAVATIPTVICTSDAASPPAEIGATARAVLARPFTVSDLAGCVSTLAEAGRTAPDDGGQFARAAAEALPFPMVAVDLGRRVRFWNAAAGRLFGWTPAEARGRVLEDIVPSDLTPEQIQSIKTHVRGGKVWHQRRLVQLRDGTVMRMMVTAAPLRDSAGRVIGHAAVFAEAAGTAGTVADSPTSSGAGGVQPVLPTTLPTVTSAPSLVRGRVHGEPSDARARRFAELVRAGHSLREIAAREGISYERVRQVLARAGYRRDRDLKDPPAA